MKVVSVENGTARLEFSVAELVILNNAMNETLNEVDEEEFSTRVGAEPADVQHLLNEVRAAYQTLAANG